MGSVSERSQSVSGDRTISAHVIRRRIIRVDSERDRSSSRLSTAHESELDKKDK
jgi:hypothetical protein